MKKDVGAGGVLGRYIECINQIHLFEHSEIDSIFILPLWTYSKEGLCGKAQLTLAYMCLFHIQIMDVGRHSFSAKPLKPFFSSNMNMI